MRELYLKEGESYIMPKLSNRKPNITKTDVIDYSDDITKIINLHNENTSWYKRSLDNGVQIGELLTKIKKSLGHGKWLPWVKDNLSFGDETARKYMDLYKFKCDDEAKFQECRDLAFSISETVDYYRYEYKSKKAAPINKSKPNKPNSTSRKKPTLTTKLAESFFNKIAGIDKPEELSNETRDHLLSIKKKLDTLFADS